MLSSQAFRASGTGSSSSGWELILKSIAQEGSCFRSLIILVKDESNNQFPSQSEEGTLHCSTALRPAEPRGLGRLQATCQARGCGRAPHRCPHVLRGCGAERCDPQTRLCTACDAHLSGGCDSHSPGAGRGPALSHGPGPRRPLAARPAPRATTVSVRACAGGVWGTEGRALGSRENTRLYHRVGGHGASFTARPPAALSSRSFVPQPRDGGQRHGHGEHGPPAPADFPLR